MSFEHVRPDHECSPLEEIAERKREDLKRVCEILDRNNSHNTESYDELAVTSFYLDKDLEKGKSQIHKEKNSVLAFVKSTLEKKAQRLIKELENAARIKKQTIDEEMKQISDYMAGQRKTYDMAKALIENGSDEEVVLSHKSVRQCVENGEKKYERKEIDDKLPQYDAEKLNRIFSHEIETSGKSK
jgi:methylphosphotriester-DNA--protein-cysteine methyltransferase